jgi:hypothetical protein
MTIPSTSNTRPVYEIKIKGHIDGQWQAWFDDLVITLTDGGDTVMQGPIVDQAALYGMLKKINNLGLTLISVNSDLNR